jgi:hypothetical protein
MFATQTPKMDFSGANFVRSEHIRSGPERNLFDSRRSWQRWLAFAGRSIFPGQAGIK